ncbi:hypothetical protein BC941DRAFT_456043 [Chlamydoabsidia padenii]|nr:hypothetical protein BC941DRAFT_456043 [Chlamydoabsidia padenii]
MFINLIIKVPKPHHTILAKKTTTVIQLCQEMDRLGIPGTPPLYNSLLQFCVTKKDTGLAWSLYDELVARCTPTKYTYSILLDLARQQQDNGRVLQIVDSMAQGGVVPDRAMVSTVMLILCDQRQYNAAADFLDQLAYHAPHIMGPQYHAVLVDTLRQHSRQQYNSLAAKQLPIVISYRDFKQFV